MTMTSEPTVMEPQVHAHVRKIRLLGVGTIKEHRPTFTGTTYVVSPDTEVAEETAEEEEAGFTEMIRHHVEALWDDEDD